MTSKLWLKISASILAVVFLAEMLAMFIVGRAGLLGSSAGNLLDAALLMLVLVPILCFWMARELRRRNEAEEARSRQRFLIEEVLNEILRISLEYASSELMLDRVLEKVLSIPWLTLQSKGAVFLSEAGRLVMKAQRGLSEEIVKSCATVEAGRCLCGRVLSSGVMEYARGLNERHETRYPGIKPHGHYSIPIKHGSTVLGVLTLYLDEGHERKKEDISFLESVTDILAGIILRERAEKALLHQEDQFRALTENALDVITVISEKGAMLYQSPSVEKLLGLPPAALVGRNVADFVHPEDLPQVLKAMELAFSQRDTPQMVEFRMRHDDGTWRRLESIGKYLGEGPSGRTLVVNSRDVSERKELEEQFRQSQKMEALGKLAGGVAHDFNNILTVIMSYVGFLRDSNAGNADALSDLNELKRAAARASALTGQLLAFSRKQTLSPRVVDLNAVIKGMNNMLSLLASENIEFILALGASSIPVLVDPGQMEQVLLNLTVNARDAMPDGGLITVRTGISVLNVPREGTISEMKAGRYAVLSVTDTGTGMSQEIQSRVFDPFFTTKGPGAGTGLGLATVYGIVKQSGGDISLESELGSGTVFTIHLPLSEEAGPGAAPEEENLPPGGGSETILLVEDDPEVRALSCRILRDKGYTVLESSRDRQARLLAARNKGRFDLMLIDVFLPGLNGYELAAELSAEHPGAKILFMSGYTGPEAIRPELLKPGRTLVQKPFAPDDLLRAVRQVLDSESAA